LTKINIYDILKQKDKIQERGKKMAGWFKHLIELLILSILVILLGIVGFVCVFAWEAPLIMAIIPVISLVTGINSLSIFCKGYNSFKEVLIKNEDKF
jgi:Co/Zn/Cd efflux system component